MMKDRATEHCRRGVHGDPDNGGMCIYCGLILSPEPDEDPNAFRRVHGWPDLPELPAVTCEACEAGMRLAPNGIHYDDARGGWTWGVCRKFARG